jgi:hypothetical protein
MTYSLGAPSKSYRYDPPLMGLYGRLPSLGQLTARASVFSAYLSQTERRYRRATSGLPSHGERDTNMGVGHIA